MKRVLTLVVISMLVLSACTVPDIPSFTTADEAVQPQYPVFTIDGELPDIGEFSGKPLKRFYEDFTPDFIPSDEYGLIVPYVGNYKTYSTSGDDPIEQGYSTYGFCTVDGKIVMDASSRTSYIYYRETDDGFGYYSVTRDIKQREDAPDEYYSDETLVIPASGEWCITLDSRSWVSQAGGGVLVICRYTDEYYENAVIELYDYDGNKLSEFTGYDSFGVYSHGLMTASKWDDKEGYSVSFVNLDGEVVLGPYSSASNFCGKGVAYVSEFNNDSYLIDTNGNRLTYGDYKNISASYGVGYYDVVFTAWCNNNGGADIIDQDGNMLGHIDTNSYISLSFPENGEILYYYTDYSDGNYNNMVWKRLSDGSDFISKEFGVSPNQYPYSDGIYVHKDEEDGKAIVFDGDGETIAVFEDWNSISQVSDDGRYLTYSTGKYNYDAQVPVPVSTVQLHIYDTEKQEDVFVVEVDGYVNFAGKDDRYALISAYEEFSMFGGYDSYYLYDTKTGEAVFEDCRYIECSTVGGEYYFNVCTQNTCTLYDSDMNVILRTYNE